MLSDLAFYLARTGERITVVTSRLSYDDPSVRLAPYESIRGVQIFRVLTFSFGRATMLGRVFDLASFYITAGIKLLAVARRGDVIVAKTDPPLVSIVAQIVATLKSARLVNWVQDVYPEVASALGVRILSGPFGQVLKTWRNGSLRAARMNVVLGERMAEHLRAARIPKNKIAIVPNWSDEKTICPIHHAANPLRTEWGLGEKCVVGYSGNLGRGHEYESMLGAAVLLRDDPQVVFLVAGGGHHVKSLKAAAEEAGLTNLIFKPYQPLAALSALLSAADIHWISLRPSLEGLMVPSKVYGILAAGRPLLAVTDPAGEIANLVRTHGCGVQVTPGDAEAFAGAVQKLAGDREHAAALGAAARRAAETVYSRDNALSRWRALLQGVKNETAQASMAAWLESSTEGRRLM